MNCFLVLLQLFVLRHSYYFIPCLFDVRYTLNQNKLSIVPSSFTVGFHKNFAHFIATFLFAIFHFGKILPFAFHDLLQNKTVHDLNGCRSFIHALLQCQILLTITMSHMDWFRQLLQDICMFDRRFLLSFTQRTIFLIYLLFHFQTSMIVLTDYTLVCASTCGAPHIQQFDLP